MTSEKLKYYFRWILVLPGAIVGGFLATFPLHWLLYFIFSPSREPVLGSIKFFVNLFPSGMNLESVEYLLSPFVVATTFIIVGYKIAPKHKFKTALVLFGIYTLTWLAISLISLWNNNLSFSLRTALALIGAIVGLCEVKRQESVLRKE